MVELAGMAAIDCSIVDVFAERPLEGTRSSIGAIHPAGELGQ